MNKMKNAALRALYGALTLSLIILGGCDQATDPNNNNDPEQEDLWKDFLYLNDRTRPLEWQHSIDQNTRVCLKFYPDCTSVGIIEVIDGQARTEKIRRNVVYDGKTLKLTSDFIGTVTKLPPETYEGKIISLNMNIEFSKFPNTNMEHYNGDYSATANYIP
jgi:hypothetical protein